MIEAEEQFDLYEHQQASGEDRADKRANRRFRRSKRRYAKFNDTEAFLRHDWTSTPHHARFTYNAHFFANEAADMWDWAEDEAAIRAEIRELEYEYEFEEEQQRTEELNEDWGFFTGDTQEDEAEQALFRVVQFTQECPRISTQGSQAVLSEKKDDESDEGIALSPPPPQRCVRSPPPERSVVKSPLDRTYVCRMCARELKAGMFPIRQLQRKAAGNKACEECLVKEAEHYGVLRHSRGFKPKAPKNTGMLWSSVSAKHWMEDVRFNQCALKTWAHGTFEYFRQKAFVMDMPAILRNMYTSGFLATSVKTFLVDEQVRERFTSRAVALHREGKLSEYALAFHGTHVRNLPSIQRHGLVVPGQDKCGVRIGVANGSSFGVGIYVSNLFSTSFYYCRDHKEMLVCMVLKEDPKTTVHPGGVIVCFDEAVVCPLFTISFTQLQTSPESPSAPLTRKEKREARRLARKSRSVTNALDTLANTI